LFKLIQILFVESARKGLLADYSASIDNANDVDRGEDWDASRSIRAAVVSALLKGALAPWRIGRNGLLVRGAKIEGSLNLDGAKIKCPLAFEKCYFELPIYLRNASLPSLDLRGSKVISGSVNS
jgi:hypothetical protein